MIVIDFLKIMWIKKLKLENFQKHNSLEIDFINGVNVLYGTSDAGKSCIRRAIEWVAQNENIDGIRKTGTKKTSVSIILDNGIEIERVRSTSINRYILREGKDEKTFDAIGKSIPDEIKDALTIEPIEVDGENIYLNSQPQIALPFLFDKSPSFRMKLFNKLTGNDVLDKLFGQFNKDILRIKRGYKEETERFEERAKELKIKEVEKEKAEAVYVRLKVRVEKIKKLYETYSKLLELKKIEDELIASKKEAKDLLNRIKIPEDIDIKGVKEKIDQYEGLKDLKNRHEKLSAGLTRVRGQLKEIRLPEVNSAELTSKISRIDQLQTIKEKLDKTQNLCYTLQRDIKIVGKDTEICIKKYKELLKEAKICPICKGEITDDCLKEITL